MREETFLYLQEEVREEIGYGNQNLGLGIFRPRLYVPEKGRERTARHLLHDDLELAVLRQRTQVLNNVP